jgi:thiol:disulfide interchange protein
MKRRECARPVRLAAAAAALALAVGSGQAAPPPNKETYVTFTTSLQPLDPFADSNAANPPAGTQFQVRRGEPFYLVLHGTPRSGYHTYPIGKKANEEQFQSRVHLKDSSSFVLLGKIAESEPKLAAVPGFELQGKQEYEYDGPFTWALELLPRSTAPASATANLEIVVDLSACNENGCHLETQVLTVPVRVSAEEAVPLSPELNNLVKEHDAQASSRSATPVPPEQTRTPAVALQDLKVVDLTQENGSTRAETGLWGTIVAAILGGLISLATPCVFPMIPITVSFFLKKAETREHSALLMAALYSLTLVAVLTAGGMALASVLQQLSQHWITNLFLTAVFVFFALSLLGMYEIELPSWLTNLTASREGKGGLLGIVFMALTFSIISFACVGPIYGGFISLEATSGSTLSHWAHRLAGPLAFSLAFASPFFLLALFPSLIKSMPRSGSWLNSVKVVMGFLELAAAFKFVRAAELNLLAKTEYFTFDLVLGIYVALCLACGLYLLGLYRLPHDHEAAESIGVPRLVIAMIFVSLGLYFLPGMFKGEKNAAQKPRGVVYDWVQAFLLPDDASEWQTDLAAAIARAEREKKPLFIDFTGLG